MDYYNEIKTKIIEDKAYSRVKDYSKQYHKFKTCYEIGEILANASKHYGEGIIKEYSKKLTNELGKGYTYTSLTRMLNFYRIYTNVATLSQLSTISWSNWVEILSIKDENEIKYYINLCENKNLSVRELRKRIRSKEYHRVKTYYEIGGILNNAGKHYGEGIIKEYSKKLEEDLGKKYSVTILKYMRQFYIFQKSQPMADLLSWSHWIELLSLKDPNEIGYYINITKEQNLSRNKLRERIQS